VIYPNLEAVAQGCTSGAINNWVELPNEARAILSERYPLLMKLVENGADMKWSELRKEVKMILSEVKSE